MQMRTVAAGAAALAVGLSGCSGAGDGAKQSGAAPGSTASGTTSTSGPTGATAGRALTLTASRTPVDLDVSGGDWKVWKEGVAKEFLLPDPRALEGKEMTIDFVDTAHHGITIVSSRPERLPKTDDDLKGFFGNEGDKVTVRHVTYPQLGAGAVVESTGSVDGHEIITRAFVFSTQGRPGALRVTAAGTEKQYLDQLEGEIIESLRPTGADGSTATS